MEQLEVLEAAEDLGQKEEKVREELKTDKSGYMKVGDIVLITMKRGNYCGIMSSDGVISQSVIVIPRESHKEKGANVLTRSCLFRIENASKISKLSRSDHELKQSLGKALTYGERVQLRHVHSMNFISVNNQTMATEAGSLQVIISEESNDKSWFELVPTSSLRKEGEIIRYNDSISLVLVSKKSRYYLHADESQHINIDSRVEVNASGGVSTWMVRRFMNFDQFGDTSSFVRTGDSFRIFHKISAAYLSTKDKEKGKVPELILQKGNLTSNSLWEIQRTVTFVGGTANWEEAYRIKHVVTGYFVQEQMQGIVLTPHGYGEGTLFVFSPDQNALKGLIMYGVVLSIQTARGRYFNLDVKETVKNELKSKKMEKLPLGLTNAVKNFTGVAFIFEDVPEVETAHVYKLSLVNPHFTDFYNFAVENVFENEYLEENPEKFKKTKEKSEEFASLLVNISEHVIFKANPHVSLRTRQDAIWEIGIINHLLSISEIIYAKLSDPSNNTEILSIVLDSIYTLLYNSIKSNRKNCKHLVKNEQILISQLELGLDRGIGHILKEIFKFATKISSINEENFTRWFNYLKYVTQDNIREQILYLNILQFLCECEGKGELRYQSLALKCLSSHQNDFTILKFHIFNKRPVIEFAFPVKYCDLQKFLQCNPLLQEVGLVIDEQNLLVDQTPTSAMFYIEDISRIDAYSNYIACAVEFLSNICIDRYTKALYSLPIITGITLPHIALVLQNVNISEKIRAAYANLCRSMFVDLEPFLPCSLHKERCYVWETLQRFDDQGKGQRQELLSSILKIISLFWGKNGGVVVNDNKPGKSLVLVTSILKLTTTIIDLELENNEFIEFIMTPLCLLMMKDPNSSDHWASIMIQKIRMLLEGDYYPSLENKFEKLQEQILDTLKVVLIRRQNLHIQEMLEVFKKEIAFPMIDSEIKIKFGEILEILDWDVSASDESAHEFDFSGEVRKKVYHMDLYLLELLFEVSGGKNTEIHKKALNVIISDLNMRKILGKELKKCEFIFDKAESELYQSINVLSKRMHSTVALLVQEQIESSDSIQVKDALKDSISVVKDCVDLFKTSQNKSRFQGFLHHSGIHHLFIQILYLKFTRLTSPLFKVTISILHLFCKGHKRNQKILREHVNRVIELVFEINVTELLCEILSNFRMHPVGRGALSVIFDLMDTKGCSIEFLWFLRGSLQDFDGTWIKSLQIDVVKGVFNSKGIRNVLENSQDAFSPQYFIDIEGPNQSKFFLHLEIIKTVIACSVNNTFGILQGRKLISVAVLKQCIHKYGMPYIGKKIYLRYLDLIYLSRIEGEVEPECNINSLDSLLRDVLIPDLHKFKSYIDPFISLAKKGLIKGVIKQNANRQKNFKLGEEDQEIINYWAYLSHKSLWCEEESGILPILTHIFSENTMPLDPSMEEAVRQLKQVLFEISDSLQATESNYDDVDLSRFILATNACREVLPRTAVYSARGKIDLAEDNPVISGMQKYIVENKLSLEEAFASFDIDAGGQIDFEEFRVTIRKLLGNISSSDIEAAFNDMDEDHSGTLQFSEFSNKIRKYFSKNPRVVKTKKAPEEDILLSPRNAANSQDDDQEEIEKKIDVNKEMDKFVELFLDLCSDQDMQILVNKVKEKYIDPALVSRDVNLSESISKLGLVFSKGKYKIYLVKILKLLVPDFELKDMIFDERDNEEQSKKLEFMKFQEMLSDAGVLELALSLIKPSSSQILIIEATHLMKSILKFGNHRVQEKFLHLLKSQNNSELFSFIRNELRISRNIIVQKALDRFIRDPNSSIEDITIKTDLEIKPKSNKPNIIHPLLEILQLCCENCFTPFQNFLRVQEKSKSATKEISINIIDEIAQFLINIKQIDKSLVVDIDAASVVIQCFETLIDACRGPCIENQILLGTKKKLLKFVNSILFLYNANKSSRNIFKSAIRFLTSLLEGNFSPDIAKTMIEFIDFKLLADLALEIYNDYILPKKSAVLQEAIVGTLTQNQLMRFINKIYGFYTVKLPDLTVEEWGIVTTGFEITIITVKLRENFRNVEELQWLCFRDEQPEYSGKPLLDDILSGIKYLGGYSESFFAEIVKSVGSAIRKNAVTFEMDEAYGFYTSLISSVEIEKDGKIEKCYFQVPSSMIFLNEQMRKDLVFGINRNSNEEKIKSFLFMSERIQLSLSHLQILSKINFVGWMISRYSSFAKVLFFAIVCTNLIVIFTVSDIRDMNFTAGSFPGKELMTFLGFVIITLSVIMYILSILSSYPLIIFNKIHKSYDEDIYNSDKTRELQGTIKMNYYADKAERMTENEQDSYAKFFFSVVFNFENLINIGFVLLACLGWYNPFFYAIMMLDILRRSDTLKNVLLVITKNKKSLGLTVILLVIIVYIYGVWGFTYLGQYYTLTDGGNYAFNTYCDSLFNCVASTFFFGVRAGGGVGDVIYPAFLTQVDYWLRLFFDISFFIIVIIILLNIIFGIIVDTFAQLRDERREIENDIENVCFVCGKEKHEFELRGSGWNKHIQIENNIWAYLAYVIYIKKKPITECDGIEKYVKNKLLQNDITFFPTTALCLEVNNEKRIDAKDMILRDLEEIRVKLHGALLK